MDKKVKKPKQKHESTITGLTDAQKYIDTVLKDWNNDELNTRIISLAKFAENWNRREGGHVAKMRKLEKTINDFNRIIKRNPAMKAQVEPVLVSAVAEMKALVEKHGELKPKVKNLSDAELLGLKK